MKLTDMTFSKMSAATRRMLLLTTILALTGFALIFMVILPLHQRIRFTHQDIASLQESFQQMERDIANMAEQEEQTMQQQLRLEEVVKLGVLEPLLGSYGMRAKTLMDPLATAVDLDIVSLRETHQVPLPSPKITPDAPYARQLVEFTTFGSYAQIAEFIYQAEQHFPLTTLAALKIDSQLTTPERHRALITFEWPVKMEVPQVDEKKQ